MANPRPIYWLRSVRLEREPAILKEKHLRFSFFQNGMNHPAIFFGGAARPLPPQPWDVAFYLEANIYRGETSLQIQVAHLRPSA